MKEGKKARRKEGRKVRKERKGRKEKEGMKEKGRKEGRK
jgi:hypothetical protein